LKAINGYALLHMIGMLMTTLGIYTYGGFIILPHMFAIYFIALSLLHISLEYIYVNDRNKKIDLSLKEDVNVLAMLGYAYGLLIISGMPLTIGFAPVQWIYQTLASNHIFAFYALIGSKILVSITSIRLIKLINEKPIKIQTQLPKKVKDWVLLIFLALIMLAGFFPNFLYVSFEQLMSGFENLIQ
jgi:uncharacterized membrane protein YhdT